MRSLHIYVYVILLWIKTRICLKEVAAASDVMFVNHPQVCTCVCAFALILSHLSSKCALIQADYEL